MKGIAQIAAVAALLLVCAPPAAAQPPASPDQPDCEAWESYRFYLLFPDADADAVRFCLREGADVNERTRR